MAPLCRGGRAAVEMVGGCSATLRRSLVVLIGGGDGVGGGVGAAIRERGEDVRVKGLVVCH